MKRTTRILAALIACTLPACSVIETLDATVTTGKAGQRTYGVGVSLRPPVAKHPSK